MGLAAACGTQGVRAAGTAAENKAQPAAGPAPLELSQYEPKRMLRVPEARVEGSKFPPIAFHTHISGSTKSEKGVERSPDREYFGTPQELLAVMDRKNI